MTDVFAKNTAISAEEASKIVPRAEFRVFGHGIIERVQEQMWNAGAVLRKVRGTPPETYLVSSHTDDANVKVREGLLDVKLKVGETREGFEIFQPRGKFPFPVKRADLAVILSHLKAEADLALDRYALNDLVALAHRHPDLVPVNVEKRRYGFTIDGIICEYARIWFNGALLETACAESENYDGLREAIRALGIDAMTNTNYLKAAKRVVGLA